MHIRNLIALLGSCVLLLAVLLEGVRAVGSPVNNVDILEPIVRRSPARLQSTNDMFGWATVLHQTEVVDNGDTRDQAAGKTRIIVGAPRGTFPGGLSYEDPGARRVEQTGLVYSCPVLPGTCDGVRGDTTRYLSNTSALDNNGGLGPNMDRPIEFPQNFVEGRLFDQAPNAILRSVEEASFLVTENKTGQLLGATLFSDGENFIACAPRWTDTRFSITQLQPRGLCYASNRILQNFQLLRPCRDNRARSTNTLFDGYCLSGTSAISYDGGYVLGAPGLREGRGALYYSARADPTMFMLGNYTQINNVTGLADDTITDSYQGFSTVSAFITTARVPGITPPNVVAAVPRYDGNTYTGRVNVFSQSNFNTILQSVDAQGTQMGEFFGHCMIAIDINGDNFDDLVIGAPMNTDFMNLKIERGRVYVFLNTGSGTLMTGNAIELNGEYPRGRFGTSLANLGDINSDGFEDFAVGAPYADNGNNTGAVYIYYGNNDRTAFENQVPFKITASDVVNYVTVLEELNTFGFSVSGGVDVDNNQYNDLVIGSYLDRTVVLLRTIPVVTVTVGITAPNMVDLNSSFTVSVTAFYEGTGVTGQIVVPFVLTEVRGSSAPRLKFADGGMGQFTITANGIANMDTQTVMVTSLENTTSLDSHMLQLDIQDIVRPVTPSDGNQTLSDLSIVPRLIQQGTNAASVMIMDPCGTGMVGCQGNIRLNQPLRNVTVTAGGPAIHTVEIIYESLGPEDAVGLSLNFTNLSKIIRNVAIQREEATSPNETPCSAVRDGNANCTLRVRFSPNGVERITINFTVDQENVIGNETAFDVGLEVISMTDRMEDRDIDTTNNAQQIGFTVAAQADISVVRLSFGDSSFDYTGVQPPQPPTVTSLGRSVTLEADIRNSGPTTIREGAVTIYLANRIMEDSFTLYPTRIPVINTPNGEIRCNMSVVNPDNLDTSSPQISGGRRRRSAATSQSSLKRVARQEVTAPVVNRCVRPNIDATTCTVIDCNIRNLKPGIFTVSVFTRIDERFFSSQSESGTTYNLTTSASASVVGDFYGDDPNNNFGQVTITLMPMPVEPPGESDRNLLHFILWPCIGGILLLILVAILLYFVGFFRRKRKPEEGEAEGDFDVDQYKMKPDNGKEPSAPEEAAPTSEVTKV